METHEEAAAGAPELPSLNSSLGEWRTALERWPNPAILLRNDFFVLDKNILAKAKGIEAGQDFRERLQSMSGPVPRTGRGKQRSGQMHFYPIQGPDIAGWFVDLCPATVAMMERRARNLELRVQYAKSRLKEETRRRRFLERQMLNNSDTERRRISMDLHDDLGQHLTGIACIARALEDSLRAEGHPAQEQCRRLVSLVNEGIGKTRTLSRGLWPVTLQGGSLDEALQSMARDLEKLHGVTCTLDTRAAGGIATRAQAHHLFRIIQEAVTNGIKHGQARHFDIVVARSGQRLTATVRNDGQALTSRGLAKPREGQGMVGMKLRAEMLGGKLAIEQSPAGGTTVRLAVPGARRADALEDLSS